MYNQSFVITLQMNKHLRHQPSMTKSTTTMDYILVHFGLPHKMNINKTIYFLCVPLGGNVPSCLTDANEVLKHVSKEQHH